MPHRIVWRGLEMSLSVRSPADKGPIVSGRSIANAGRAADPVPRASWPWPSADYGRDTGWNDRVAATKPKPASRRRMNGMVVRACSKSPRGLCCLVPAVRRRCVAQRPGGWHVKSRAAVWRPGRGNPRGWVGLPAPPRHHSVVDEGPFLRASSICAQTAPCAGLAEILNRLSGPMRLSFIHCA